MIPTIIIFTEDPKIGISMTQIGRQRFKIMFDISDTLTQTAITLTNTRRQFPQLTTNLSKLTGGSIHTIKRKPKLALHYNPPTAIQA